MHAYVVPKNKSKVRTIRRSDKLIGNKSKQIIHCLDVIIWRLQNKTIKLLLQESLKIITEHLCTLKKPTKLLSSSSGFEA